MTGLVLIDVDGTLYGPNGVPDCAWAAAELARAAGIHLAVCTGRPGRGFALEYARRLDPQGLHIFESGAVVVGGDGGLERVCLLPDEAYQSLLELSRLHRLPFEVYTAEGGFYRESDHPDLLAHERMLGFPAEVRNLEHLPGQIIRVQYVVELGGGWEVLRQQVLEVAGVELHEATSPGMPGMGFNSVTAQGVSKLSAAAWMAQRYGLTLEQTAMVGDGENDLELIRAAGLGIAMGNSPASVKAAARYVVPSVEECGLAEALRRVMTENRADASSPPIR
ncbi:MAG TPA: HAD-IIB family hydrolase [Meiothermus sp.]|nr:HAD-IIB family hydrolase [Meiothermus sp.]